jgi:GDP/UDP-N,N'-diacetylbacillosamine 2-epimerase (hydrolysing)
MIKGLFVFESRASLGYSLNLVKKIKKINKIKIFSLITGTHLSKELGNSLNEVKKNLSKIDYKIRFKSENISIGSSYLMYKVDKILKKIKPKFIFIFGDRLELMPIAIAALYNDVAIFHVQAGDKSGHIDNTTRMVLAKISHLHFPATEIAKKRLIKLGEEKFRIHKVGAPQLDDINKKEIKNNYLLKNIDLRKLKYFVVLQHSVFKDKMSYKKKFYNTLKAVLKFDYKVFIIYPNYDPGYRSIISLINSFQKKYPNKVEIFKHLERKSFLSLIFYSTSFIGNSSSGILETPSLNIGTVNIGDRQNGRELSKNIFNTNYKTKSIIKAIKKSIKYNQFHKHKNLKNIHGDGKASEKIIRVIKRIKNFEKLLNKKTTY